MPFGPETHVIRKQPCPDKVDEIWLAPYTQADAAPLFPFAEDDPALDFLGLYEPERLRNDTPATYIERGAGDPEVLSWGVWTNEGLEGFTELKRGSDGTLGYGILLASKGRGRGSGGLATGGITGMAFMPGLVARYLDDFPDTASVITTIIHPNNRPSRTMCQRYGFAAVGGVTQYEVGGRRRVYPWVEYILPGPAGWSLNRMLPKEVARSWEQRGHSMNQLDLQRSEDPIAVL
jgi:hypothetical protein